MQIFNCNFEINKTQIRRISREYKMKRIGLSSCQNNSISSIDFLLYDLEIDTFMFFMYENFFTIFI